MDGSSVETVMPPIRTDRSGFGFAFVGATAFIFLCTVPGILMVTGYEPNLDALMLSCLAGGLVFTVALFVGHLILNRLRVGQRWAYVALGSVALVGAYASQMPPSDLMAVAGKGLLFYFFTLPAITGAVFGFIYAWRAGWEIEREHPDALSEALAGHPDRAAGTASAPTPAVVETAEARYFHGPLRVRTSFMLMFLAALLSAFLGAVARALIGMGIEASYSPDRTNAQVLDHAVEMSLGVGLEMFFLILVGVLPIFLCVIAGHFLARGLKRTAAWAYFGIGLLMPLALALFSFGLLLVLGAMILLPTAVAMVLYRQFAGLEPAPVQEDVLVSDERHLVGADHPRRQYGRVLKTR